MLERNNYLIWVKIKGSWNPLVSYNHSTISKKIILETYVQAPLWHPKQPPSTRKDRLLSWYALERKSIPGSQWTKSLVGGFNPFEKYARQIGSFPQGSGWKYKIFELPPPRSVWEMPCNCWNFCGFVGDQFGEANLEALSRQEPQKYLCTQNKKHLKKKAMSQYPWHLYTVLNISLKYPTWNPSWSYIFTVQVDPPWWDICLTKASKSSSCLGYLWESTLAVCSLNLHPYAACPLL